MNKILPLLNLTLTAALVVLFSFLLKRTKKFNLEKANAARKHKKEKEKKEIIRFVTKHGKITNDQVQQLLGVSDAHSTTLLEELEEESKITQRGEKGRGVFYTLKKADLARK